MTDWTARDLDVPLRFLGSGMYQLNAFEDGVNAHHTASDYRAVTRRVEAGSTLHLHMAGGGGWVGRFHAEGRPASLLR